MGGRDTVKTRYEFVGFDAAISLLRPKAKWKIDHGSFVWEDPRPVPTKEEIEDTIRKIKDFEESINYILLPEQEEQSPDPAQEDVLAGISPYKPLDSDGGSNELGGVGGKGGVPIQNK